MGIEEGTAELRRVLDGVVCPECGAALVPSGGDGEPRALECGSCDRSVLWYPGERRLEYGVALPEGEREKYDRWAARQASRGFGYEPRRSVDLEDWFDRSASMAELASAWPEARDLEGRRILDVGGSCKDSWRFLGMGAGRVDQLDVSPASQRLGLARLEAALAGVDVDWRERIVFHTVPAEALPFEAGAFDLIFSRASIHHVDRALAFPEIARVLRPGGVMVLLEPRFPWLVYQAMRARRRLLRVDRGTDDPLRTREIRGLEGLFREVTWRPSGVLGLPARVLSSVPGVGPGLASRLTELDRRITPPGGLGRLLGTYCWVVARK